MAQAEGEKRNMTPLDSAYVTATENDEKQSDFYNLFLSSELFIPTHAMPESENHRRADENESISPIFIESDGIQHLMLFDSKERLSAWAQREIGFVALPGHAIVEMMDIKFHWALNVGTDHVKTFETDEIQWLKQTVGQSKGVSTNVASGTEVLIGAPAKIPEGLIESIIKNLDTRNNEVKKAYLGQVYYVKDNEVPHLALVLDMEEVPESIIKSISNDLGIATRGFIGDSKHIDIMIKKDSGITTDIINAVEPFYVSNK